jgi:hypothetical protein
MPARPAERLPVEGIPQACSENRRGTDHTTTPEEVRPVWILSVAAIVLGLIVAIADANLWMPAQNWFLLAIALALLRPGELPFVRRRT